MRRPSRAEPETARQEVRLENRLKHDLASGLHNVVPDRKIRQRPQPAHPGFGIITRGAGSGRYRPCLSSAARSSSRAYPASRHQPRWPGRCRQRRCSGAFLATRAPGRLCGGLVQQRAEPSSGICPGRPVLRVLQGTHRLLHARAPRAPRAPASPGTPPRSQRLREPAAHGNLATALCHRRPAPAHPKRPGLHPHRRRSSRVRHPHPYAVANAGSELAAEFLHGPGAPRLACGRALFDRCGRYEADPAAIRR